MLMIDIGNSQIKSAVWQEDGWQGVGTLLYCPENLQGQLDILFKGISIQPVYVACVVDNVREVLTGWFLENWSLQPAYAETSGSLCGVINAYEKPDALGVDRWLAMVAAYNKFKSPVCVIDCGTAITVDVIDAGGLHQGGLIMPGLQLMRASLFSNASKLKSCKGNLVSLAKNTADAVESGCVRVIASGLSVIGRQQLDAFPGMQIVMTGGDGEYISRQMSIKISLIDMLVLDGLRIIAMKGC